MLKHFATHVIYDDIREYRGPLWAGGNCLRNIIYVNNAPPPLFARTMGTWLSDFGQKKSKQMKTLRIYSEVSHWLSGVPCDLM